jgi:hypothetical protein
VTTSLEVQTRFTLSNGHYIHRKRILLSSLPILHPYPKTPTRSGRHPLLLEPTQYLPQYPMTMKDCWLKSSEGNVLGDEGMVLRISRPRWRICKPDNVRRMVDFGWR